MIGCDCEVCLSTNTKDKRLRTSILLSAGSTNVAIDCGPDFRQQMLRSEISHLDAVVFTHEHNDHIIGIDDVRSFNFKQKADMPMYASARVIKELQERFAYVFVKNPYPGAPMIKLNPIDKDSYFSIGDLDIQSLEVIHGSLPVLGFRIGSFTYITDMKTISEEEKKKIAGTHTLVVNALHHSEHHSHLNLTQALDFIAEIQPKRALITHISHRMGLYDQVCEMLPEGVTLAYDDLVIEIRSER